MRKLNDPFLTNVTLKRSPATRFYPVWRVLVVPMKPLSLTETEKRALSVLLIILISASIGVYLFRSPDNAFKAQESVGLQMETNPGRN